MNAYVSRPWAMHPRMCILIFGHMSLAWLRSARCGSAIVLESAPSMMRLTNRSGYMMDRRCRIRYDRRSLLTRSRCSRCIDFNRDFSVGHLVQDIAIRWLEHVSHLAKGIHFRSLTVFLKTFSCALFQMAQKKLKQAISSASGTAPFAPSTMLL